MILGQDKLIEFINKSSLDTFPRTLMLLGPLGSGKHLISNYISSKFNLNLLDITSTLDYDTIEEINQRIEPFLYIIEINKITVKEQNTILKFLEEPLKNSYILLLAESTLGILNTILNRCQVWTLQSYRKEDLKQFLSIDNMEILDVAETPGQVQQLCECPFEAMKELIQKIIEKIQNASIPNTLTVSSKIAFKEEKNKFNLDLFLLMLLYFINKYWRNTSDTRLVHVYQLTMELQNKLRIPNVEKNYLFERYLLQLRSCMRGTLL